MTFSGHDDSTINIVLGLLLLLLLSLIGSHRYMINPSLQCFDTCDIILQARCPSCYQTRSSPDADKPAQRV